jgi:hypothetical protein
MKRISARALVVGASMAMCVFVLHSCWVRIHAVERFVCSFDKNLSAEMQQEISASLSNKTGMPAHEVISFLTSQFPCISQVGFQIQPSKEALISVNAQIPLVRINEMQVLTQTARLISMHDFDSHLIASLSHIQVMPDVLSDAGALAELQRHFKNIEPIILQEFNVTWHKSNEIVLADMRNPLVHYVCSAHQLADHKRIQSYVDQVAQLMLERASSPASKKQLIADVRFENQLVLRGPAMSNVGKNVTNGSKGGIQHGTRIS